MSAIVIYEKKVVEFEDEPVDICAGGESDFEKYVIYASFKYKCIYTTIFEEGNDKPSKTVSNIELKDMKLSIDNEETETLTTIDDNNEMFIKFFDDLIKFMYEKVPFDCNTSDDCGADLYMFIFDYVLEIHSDFIKQMLIKGYL